MHRSFAEYLVAEYVYRVLKDNFLEAGKYEEYPLNDKEEALELWHNLYSRRQYSLEIWEYLCFKIENDEEAEERKALWTRLEHFAPYFFQQGFLNRLDTEDYEQTTTKRAIGAACSWMLVTSALMFPQK